MRKKNNNHGGARPGSGPKPLPPGKKRIFIGCRIAPETLAQIEILRHKGEKLGRFLDRIIGGVEE